MQVGHDEWKWRVERVCFQLAAKLEAMLLDRVDEGTVLGPRMGEAKR